MAVKTAADNTVAQECVSTADSGKKFSKEQLAGSARYAARRDLVNALLDDGKGYTIQEADAAIAGYMEGKVV